MSFKHFTFVSKETFEPHQVMTSLDKKVIHNQQELQRYPKGDADRAVALFMLTDSLNDQYLEKGQMTNLDEAIFLHQLSLDLCPATIPDLEESIILYRAALELCPSHHPHHATTLNNLADCLRKRFMKLDTNTDLDEAILLHQSVLELCPADHPNQLDSFFDLAHCLSNHYDKQATIPDLEESIMLYRAALELYPSGHPSYTGTLNNLADCLRKRFMRLGANDNLNEYDRQATMIDLEKSIMLGQAALDLQPSGHSRRATTLTFHANCLKDRFKKLRTSADIDETWVNSSGSIVLYWIFNHWDILITLRLLKNFSFMLDNSSSNFT
ncbi:hypothetical protein J3A83DRAFT_4186118 [Scleroderma citrinum]